MEGGYPILFINHFINCDHIQSINIHLFKKNAIKEPQTDVIRSLHNYMNI